MVVSMGSVGFQLDRFSPVLPDVDAPVIDFDQAEAVRLIEIQMRRIAIEYVPGSIEWCESSDPKRLANIRRLFWSADVFCQQGDMDGFVQSLESFLVAWRQMLDDFVAARDCAARQLELM